MKKEHTGLVASTSSFSQHLATHRVELCSKIDRESRERQLNGHVGSSPADERSIAVFVGVFFLKKKKTKQRNSRCEHGMDIIVVISFLFGQIRALTATEC